MILIQNFSQGESTDSVSETAVWAGSVEDDLSGRMVLSSESNAPQEGQRLIGETRYLGKVFRDLNYRWSELRVFGPLENKKSPCVNESGRRSSYLCS